MKELLKNDRGKGFGQLTLITTGGGFVLGGLANESTLCMSMCDGAGVAVVDVNYRHCPGSFQLIIWRFLPRPHLLT